MLFNYKSCSICRGNENDPLHWIRCIEKGGTLVTKDTTEEIKEQNNKVSIDKDQLDLINNTMYLMAEYIKTRNPEYKDFPTALVINIYMTKAAKSGQSFYNK